MSGNWGTLGAKPDEPTRERIVALRREWRTMRQIAQIVGVGQSSVARVCRRAGLSRLRQLEPAAVPVRYEREEAGDLLHIDIKRLGRFDRVGHRITRQRSFGSKKQGLSSSMWPSTTSPASRMSTSWPTSAASRPAPS